MTGKFNVRMTVEEKKQVDDGFGDGTPTKWVAMRPEMFSLEAVVGDEIVTGQQTQGRSEFKARCHFFQGANPSLRLTKDGRVFHVESVTNWMERNKFLDWRLIERV